MHSMNANAVALKSAEREKLEADMARFLAQGGQPYQAEPHESAGLTFMRTWEGETVQESRMRGTIAGHRARGIA